MDTKQPAMSHPEPQVSIERAILDGMSVRVQALGPSYMADWTAWKGKGTVLC